MLQYYLFLLWIFDINAETILLEVDDTMLCKNNKYMDRNKFLNDFSKATYSKTNWYRKSNFNRNGKSSSKMEKGEF